MAEIRVTRTAPHRFTVTVREGGSSTSHEVTVPDRYLEQLGLRDADETALVHASFAFLLEREPKESILARFDLPVIERYFPEYPAALPRFLR